MNPFDRVITANLQINDIFPRRKTDKIIEGFVMAFVTNLLIITVKNVAKFTVVQALYLTAVRAKVLRPPGFQTPATLPPCSVRSSTNCERISGIARG